MDVFFIMEYPKDLHFRKSMMRIMYATNQYWSYVRFMGSLIEELRINMNRGS